MDKKPWKWSLNGTQATLILYFGGLYGVAGESVWFFIGGVAFWYAIAVIGQNLTR